MKTLYVDSTPYNNVKGYRIILDRNWKVKQVDYGFRREFTNVEKYLIYATTGDAIYCFVENASTMREAIQAVKPLKSASYVGCNNPHFSEEGGVKWFY